MNAQYDEGSGVGKDFHEATLLKAVFETASRLGLSSAELAQILGLSRATVCRMRAAVAADAVVPRPKMKSKTWELSIHLVRTYRAIHALVGGNDCDARLWFDGAVAGLSRQRPRDAVRSIEGLIRVEQYLDAFRARA